MRTWFDFKPDEEIRSRLKRGASFGQLSQRVLIESRLLKVPLPQLVPARGYDGSTKTVKGGLPTSWHVGGAIPWAAAAIAT